MTAAATLDLFGGPTPTRTAKISECGLYRYRLDVDGLGGEGRVCWVMLNPSKATADVDDPTLTKVTGYTTRWGYAGLTIVNLYAWRTTFPTELPEDLADAVGPDADDDIMAALAESDLVVCGWGNSIRKDRRRPRERRVLQLITEAGKVPQRLKSCADGAPWHPLYLRNDLKPFVPEET
jgi:hypothetical protein